MNVYAQKENHCMPYAVFTSGDVFASLTSGGTTSVPAVPRNTPFFIEVDVTATDQEEFDEGASYSLNVIVTNLANSLVFLNVIIRGSLGDTNWPTLASRIEIPVTSGALNDLYSIHAVLLSGRVNPGVEFAFGRSLIVVTL
jgi:hypothetical protein